MRRSCFEKFFKISIDKFAVKIKKGKKQEKKVITDSISEKERMLDIDNRLVPDRYKPNALNKRIAACLSVFVFIIGGNYKLILFIVTPNLMQNKGLDSKIRCAVAVDHYIK
jgi:hypothetical protein